MLSARGVCALESSSWIMRSISINTVPVTFHPEFSEFLDVLWLMQMSLDLMLAALDSYHFYRFIWG